MLLSWTIAYPDIKVFLQDDSDEASPNGWHLTTAWLYTKNFEKFTEIITPARAGSINIAEARNMLIQGESKMS